MNTRGLVPLLTIMIAVVVIIVALATAPVIKEFNETARADTTATAQGLGCDNTSISDFTKATCIAADLFSPMFIGILLGLAGVIVGARIIIGGAE